MIRFDKVSFTYQESLQKVDSRQDWYRNLARLKAL